MTKTNENTNIKKAHFVYYNASENKLYIKTGKAENAKIALKRIVEKCGGLQEGDKVTRVNAFNAKNACELFNAEFGVNAELMITRHHEPRPTFEEFSLD